MGKSPLEPDDAQESTPDGVVPEPADAAQQDDAPIDQRKRDGQDGGEAKTQPTVQSQTQPATQHTTQPEKPSFWHRWWGNVPSWARTGAAVVLLSLAAVIVGIEVGGTGTYDIGPLKVQMSLRPSIAGESRVDIPPLGSLTFNSHDGPLKVLARIDELDESETRDIVENPDQLKQASEEAVSDVTTALKNVAGRALITTGIVALLLGLMIFRDLRRTLLTTGVSLVLLVSILGVVFLTRHPEGVREPRYDGLLANAPSVIGDARNIYDNFGEYRGSLAQMIENWTRIYANLSKIGSSYAPDPNTIRVLHVSDLHLNPSSFAVIKAVAEQFNVTVVVDTGDITDWGTDLENEYAGGIAALGRPYVFVRGNHDAQATADAVAAQPGAVVLENSVATVGGLTFAGIGDPRYTPDKSSEELSHGANAAIEADRKLASTITSYNKEHQDDPVDVALVHDPRGAKELVESTPLILCGHMHERSSKELDSDTLLRVEGSTGAEGLRGLYDEQATSAFQMSVLYFSTAGALQAADEITISGPGQSTVTIDRKRV